MQAVEDFLFNIDFDPAATRLARVSWLSFRDFDQRTHGILSVVLVETRLSLRRLTGPMTSMNTGQGWIRHLVLVCAIVGNDGAIDRDHFPFQRFGPW